MARHLSLALSLLSLPFHVATAASTTPVGEIAYNAADKYCTDITQSFKVYESNEGHCTQLEVPYYLVKVLSLNKGCTFTVYTDSGCQKDAIAAAVNVCVTSPIDTQWASYDLSCS